jgi:hypothetical protein
MPFATAEDNAPNQETQNLKADAGGEEKFAGGIPEDSFALTVPAPSVSNCPHEKADPPV